PPAGDPRRGARGGRTVPRLLRRRAVAGGRRRLRRPRQAALPLPDPRTGPRPAVALLPRGELAPTAVVAALRPLPRPGGLPGDARPLRGGAARLPRARHPAARRRAAGAGAAGARPRRPPGAAPVADALGGVPGARPDPGGAG